ncbi:hypothetical protein NLM33_38575 [Bradyrhizobium sp. CCGUVB1N3]|uniref:hypothetical protein n=1 Tax=Bradyrhizobium sp. CCGUVB1N3 TaxID=2949629 RepID=UPI0020B1BEE0|nr:hypothetical protein [Bradyrhizobium sp. CCGUVB1N3]MCP3476135.1 hypothetical protein [Bradyrhizobium sp. CCGUVB1N3]
MPRGTRIGISRLPDQRGDVVDLDEGVGQEVVAGADHHSEAAFHEDLNEVNVVHGLIEFCTFFLTSYVEQVVFMESLFAPAELQ